jgi:hypothetical protein
MTATLFVTIAHLLYLYPYHTLIRHYCRPCSTVLGQVNYSQHNKSGTFVRSCLSALKTIKRVEKICSTQNVPLTR